MGHQACFIKVTVEGIGLAKRLEYLFVVELYPELAPEFSQLGMIFEFYVFDRCYSFDCLREATREELTSFLKFLGL